MSLKKISHLSACTNVLLVSTVMSVGREGNTSGVYISPPPHHVWHTQPLPLIKGFTFSLMLMSNKCPVSPGAPPIPSVPLTNSHSNLTVTAQAGVCEAVEGWDCLVSLNRTKRSSEPRCTAAVITTSQVRQVEHLRCFLSAYQQLLLDLMIDSAKKRQNCSPTFV